MRKTMFLAMSVAVLMGVTSCGSKKNAVEPQKPIYGGMTEIEVPCKETGFDDADYFRATATSTSVNQQSARLGALKSAKAFLFEKLGGYVQGLSSNYSTAVAGQAQADKVQRLMEGEINQVVERMVNDAEQTCDRSFIDNNTGNYVSWMSIQIPKKELVNNMEKALSDNEELEIYFKRDEFRKYAEEKMQQMKAARKEATGR